MGREIDRLSARFVTTVTEHGYHADGLGLYLVVDKHGKRWSFVFQWRGKRREMGLGPVYDVKLADARDERTKARKLIRDGKNPIDERRRSADLTWGEVADSYLETRKDLDPKTLASWKNSLEAHAVKLRPKAPADIVTEDVLAVLKPIWTDKPEIASKTRGRIEKVFDAAKAKGLRDGENPARWRGHLELMLAPPQKLSKGHHAALPYTEVADFMKRLDGRPAMAARALETTILAATRTNETVGARGPEFDFTKKVWTIPAERMKKVRGQPRKEHRVPITPALEAVVRPLVEAAGEGFVFEGAKKGRPISTNAMDKLLERMGRDDITVHGFRSTFKDWASEQTETPNEIVEMSLAHKVGTDVERAYRRGDALDRRRLLMAAWSSFCGR